MDTEVDSKSNLKVAIQDDLDKHNLCEDWMTVEQGNHSSGRFKLVEQETTTKDQSTCWKFFLHVVEAKSDNATGYVACKKCHSVYSNKPRSGTSRLNRHIAKCYRKQENEKPSSFSSVSEEFHVRAAKRRHLYIQQEACDEVDSNHEYSRSFKITSDEKGNRMDEMKQLTNLPTCQDEMKQEIIDELKKLKKLKKLNQVLNKDDAEFNLMGSRCFRLEKETKSKAGCWKLFSRVVDHKTNMNTDFVACNECQKVYYNTTLTGTTLLNNHLKKCKEAGVVEDDIENKIAPLEPTVQSNKRCAGPEQPQDNRAVKKAKSMKIHRQSFTCKEAKIQQAERNKSQNSNRRSQSPKHKQSILAQLRKSRKVVNSLLTREQKVAQLEKRNAAFASLQSKKKVTTDDAIEDLAQKILEMIDVDNDTIKFMADNQNFTRHPKLALVYYHLCELDPNLFVFNDECLQGEEGEAVCKRLIEALGSAIGKDEAISCQESMEANDTAGGRIAACASCNEILFECDRNIVDTDLESVHANFLLTDEEIANLQTVPVDLVNDFVSVYRCNGNHYHLNPDLIVGNDSIVLCEVCNTDPLSHPYSLASGHDYGRRRHFPEINGTTLGVVTPVRNYNINVLVRPRHATGHSICFPSDGPAEAVKVLPCLDPLRIPQVTFLGPTERWRAIKGQWRHLLEIDVEKAYKVLRIWVGLGNPAFDGISISDSPETLEQLEKLTELIEQEMIQTQDPSAIDVSKLVADLDQEDEDEFDDEEADDNVDLSRTRPVKLVYSAVLPHPSLASMGGVHSGINALLEIIQPKQEDGHMSNAMLAEIAAQDSRRAGGGERGDNTDSEEGDEESLADDAKKEELDPYAEEDAFWSACDEADGGNTLGIGCGQPDDADAAFDDASSVDFDSDDTDQEDESINEDNKAKTPTARPVIVVTRDADPLVEWDENDLLLGGAFPHLFLLGKGLPTGEMKLAFLKHCFKFYDGRFEDPVFISTAFNQKQRHACIRSTARIALGHAKKFEMLGRLANSDDFREILLWASKNPNTTKAKKLNAKVCKMFSMVGKTIPFSPFERVSTRPRLEAMRLRYSAATMFHTGAPPEFEDLTVLRVHLIPQFNDKTCVLSQSGCTRDKLPEDVRCDTGIRMNMTSSRPVLAAQAFIRKERLFNNSIMKCKIAAETRVSRNYTERERGAFGPVAAHNTVIEPQLGGRLHWHKMVYLSGLTPTLMDRVAAGPEYLRRAVAGILDSLSCTKVSNEVHEWYDALLTEKEKENSSSKWPRAADFSAPKAKSEYDKFLLVAMMAAMLTNRHTHGFTCEKTKKGRYMCRLAVPRGVHESPTCPLLVVAENLGNAEKGVRAVFHSEEVADDADLQEELDAGYDTSNGEFTRSLKTVGPIIWELNRPERDEMFIEANLIVTILLQCHNNASLITSLDGSEAVEEYAAAYMTKEGASLRQAAAVLLAAVDHISKHTSKADDSGTLERTGKHLAQRTLNAFTGSHQWSIPLMVYALHGFKSYASTESFIYTFPHDNVSSYDKHHPTGEVDAPADIAEIPMAPDVAASASIQELLASVDKISPLAEDCCVGATPYKVGDKCIFLNQADSYINRGGNFLEYGQLEFECIVELLPKKGEQLKRGRHQRIGFDLGEGHPLYDSHQGFIRAKMRTAILAGQPPPKFPGNSLANNSSRTATEEDTWMAEMDKFAKFLMCFMVPWNEFKEPMYSFDTFGLLALLDNWDRRSASLLNRQRIRTIHNFISKGNRNGRNEQIASGWRERAAARWAEVGLVASCAGPNESCSSNLQPELEAEGRLTEKELYQITVTIADSADSRYQTISVLRDMCEDLHGISHDALPLSGEAFTIRQPVVHMQRNNNQSQLSLSSIQKQIRAMTSIPGSSPQIQQDGDDTASEGDISDAWSARTTQRGVGPLPKPCVGESSFPLNSQLGKCTLTSDQNKIVSAILDGEQGHKLVLLHSGGGTGKSTVVGRLNELFNKKGFSQANCCPTGVGATHLPQGRTFHSLFKTHMPHLNAGKAIDDIKEQLGGDKLKLVVVDEVSMLQANFLTLLDHRLKAMYDPSTIFGGIAVLLLGDFLQLPSVAGTALYRVMYPNIKTEDVMARSLFSEFKVVTLEQQLRAASDANHQKLLQAFRALPEKYPKPGTTWHEDDKKSYKPMTKKMIEAVTTELTRAEVLADHSWTTKGICLTTSNLDRCIINGAVAPIFAQITGQTILRWRRQLAKEIPACIEHLLYSENMYPELFAHFVYGAPGQILDNGNGNVCFGVANGTPCKLISLGWDDAARALSMSKFVKDSVEKGAVVVDIPCAPDFIIVEVKVEYADKWPSQLNLSEQGETIHIPVGLKTKRGGGNKDTIVLGGETRLPYFAHAVDLAFAVTAWKSQGGTYDYVIAYLESKNGPKLTYENLYVMFSRVRLGSHFRCIPLLSPGRTKLQLSKLRPNLYAVRWRMDIGADGKWFLRHVEPNAADKQRRKPKARAAKKVRTSKQRAVRSELTKSASKNRSHPETPCVTNRGEVSCAKQTCSEAPVINKQAPAEMPCASNIVTGHKVKQSKVVNSDPKFKKLYTESIEISASPISPCHRPSLTCDGSPLYPKVKKAQCSTVSRYNGLTTPSRAMSIATGLPLVNVEQWGMVNFMSTGLTSLLQSEWLTQDPIDLFAELDCQTSDQVSYIPSCAYSSYIMQVLQGTSSPECMGGSQLQAVEMIRKPLWVAILNHNRSHWQLLCIINHGTSFCLGLLMDSLVEHPRRPSNWETAIAFANLCVEEVYTIAGQLPPVIKPAMQLGMVTNQPNGNDCGVFSLLNLKHVVHDVNHMLQLRVPVPPKLSCLDFRWWYDKSTGMNYRSYLYQRYEELLVEFSIEEKTGSGVNFD